MKHVKALGAFILIILIFSGVYVYFNPSVLENLGNINQNTIITPPTQIFVQPQDSAHVIGDEYYGSFWSFTAQVTANDDIAGVLLPEGQEGSVTYEGAVRALKTGASVEIKIDPGQPYIIRDIVEKTDLVAAPDAVWAQITPALKPRYYDWSEPSFRIYTPFTVSVYKDGALVGQKELGKEGAVSQINTVDTSEGPVRIENLGILGGEYMGFSYSNPVVMLKGGPYIYDKYAIQNYVGNTGQSTYGAYWYGTARNTAGQAYNPMVTFGLQQGPMFPPSKYGGWSGNDVGTNVQAVQPVTFSGEKGNLPSGKASYYCFTEFLEQGHQVQNIALTTFNTRAAGATNSLWQKSSLVSDPRNGATALRLDIPWAAFGTPQVNIRVPTELADTWIDLPIVADVDVSAIWESSGTINQDLYGSNRIKCTVTNRAQATGSTRLAISSDNPKLSVTPLAQTVNNLVKDVPQTVYFDAANLGVENQVTSIPVTIIATDTYTGTETGRCVLYGTLKPTLTEGTTTLHLYVVEKGTSVPAKSLGLSIQYGSSAPPGIFTNENGEVTLTLATPQGGAYTGLVYVTSDDTAVYKTHSQTYNLQNPTAYEFTMEVERKDTPYAEEIDWMLIAIVIAVTLIIAAIAVVVIKKKSRRRRRR